MERKLSCLFWTILAGLILVGCLPTAEQEFKDALPNQDDLKIVMGQTDDTDAAPKSIGDCPECCIDEEDGNFVDSETYTMTRSAIYHVNGTLVAVYIWFNYIVQLPYSQEITNGYIWGPWDDTDIDPLSRLSYRFKMTENSDSSFDYALEIKLITNDTDEWTPYCYGNVLPTDEPHKGTGTMTIDFDALHDLDSAHPSQFHGQVAYDFDVRQVAPSLETPNTVTTNFTDFWEDPNWGQGEPVPINADYYYERYAQLSGKLNFESLADFTGPDEQPDGIDETFTVQSKWNSDGKGIGVATVTGDSLDAMNVESYSLTECWADSDYLYYETYDIETLTYTDGTEPLEELNCGDEEHCPVFDLE